jgi:coenzyme F420-0:L-glutamate ligase / coenzyme F420-1:gamma-L-glutamate ligase
MITALGGIPRVRPGDDLAAHLIAAIANAGIKPRPQDVVVVAQKIVSKAEGRYLDLSRIVPSARARELAEETGKDARLVEVILRESDEVVRTRAQVLIVAHRLGFVMANAGIDRSNIDLDLGDDPVLLLPRDPDASAMDIKRSLDAHFETNLGVVISDSFGRAWRIGTVGVAIGAAGIPAVVDRRGEKDLNGHPLMVTVSGFADAVAASAVMVMGEAAESIPAAMVRGLEWTAPEGTAAEIVRPRDEDLFR